MRTRHDSQTGLIEIPQSEGLHGEPFSLRKIKRLLTFFGPAALLASLAIGAGETILVTGVGAWAEYGLLWLVLVGVLVKAVFVTYLLGRYTAVSGQYIGHSLVGLPGPRGWLILTLIVIELVGLSLALTAVAKPCGNLVVFLLEGALPQAVSSTLWENLVTTLFLGAAMALSLTMSYDGLERQQIVICGVLVCGTVLGTWMVWPSISGILIGTLSVGSLPDVPDWGPPAARNDYWLNLVTVFGYVGGTISAYLAYSNWVGIRGWGITSHPEIARIRDRSQNGFRIDYLSDSPIEVQRMQVLLKPLRWDVAMGAVVLFIVTASFMIAGAIVLYPRHQILPGNAFDLLTSQSAIWAEIHTGLVPVYHVAVLASLWGTLATIPEAVTRVTHEFLSAVWKSFETFPYKALQTIIVVWFFAASCVWIWSDISFALLTQIVAMFTTNLGVGLLGITSIYLNYKLPPPYRARGWVVCGAVVSTVVLMLAFTASAIGVLGKI